MASDTDGANTNVDVVFSKLAIHDLSMAYCRAMDRCDENLLRSVCHPDSTFVSGVVDGPLDVFAPGIIAHLRSSLKSSFHAIANEWVEITGDRAKGESYVIGIISLGDGENAAQFISGGRYLDQYERRAGTWKFLQRNYVPDFMVNCPSPIAGQPFGTAFGKGGRKPDDPIYAFWPQVAPT